MLANSLKNALTHGGLSRLNYVRVAGNQQKFFPFSKNLNGQRRWNSGAGKVEGEGSETNGEANIQDPKQNKELNACLDENKKLLETVKDLDDKYKRALAETENTRIRMRKQIEDAKIYAVQSFCKDLLDVADVFSAAIESVPKDSLGNNPAFKTLFDGVVMTEQQLQSVFRRHGLVPINPIGSKFNPNEHHALFEVEAPGKEPGTVSIVTKIGYKLHDRTVRPAMVGVVKNK